MSGVDLKEYIRPTQQQTFASSVSAGLFDVAKYDDSKILQFISRRPEQPSLVTETVRQQEYEAFREWVRAAASDSTLIADVGAQQASSAKPSGTSSLSKITESAPDPVGVVPSQPAAPYPARSV